MLQKESEGKYKKATKIATLNRFLRQYYDILKLMKCVMIMELNINSPVYYKDHYGIVDQVYKFC